MGHSQHDKHKIKTVARNKNTFKASCCGEDDKTVVRSSMLFRATSNVSLVCSGEKRWTGISWWTSWARLAFDSEAETERGGVNIGAKLSLSRPGNLIPLDLRL